MTFIEILVLIVVIIIAVIAVKISITFDLTKWLENRRKTANIKAQNLCPHVRIYPIEKDKYEIESLFVSPPGTTSWICQQCNATSYTNPVPNLQRQYSDNPMKLLNQQKDFEKHIKKMKIL